MIKRMLRRVMDLTSPADPNVRAFDLSEVTDEQRAFKLRVALVYTLLMIIGFAAFIVYSFIR